MRLRSARSKPVTGSLKTMVICGTAEYRGSGATGAMVAVGGVPSVFIVHVSLALAVMELPAASAMPDPEAVNAST